MNNSNKDKYILTLTASQAKFLSHICEFYARVKMGQWQEISEETMEWNKDNFDDCLKRRDDAEALLLYARAKIWPKLGNSIGTSWGVGHDKQADMAWEFYEVLRNKIAWNENPEGGWTVDFDTPMSWSGEPLPNCKVKKEE